MRGRPAGDDEQIERLQALLDTANATKAELKESLQSSAYLVQEKEIDIGRGV